MATVFSDRNARAASAEPITKKSAIHNLAYAGSNARIAPLVYHVFSMKTSSVPRAIHVMITWIVAAASTRTLPAASEHHYLYVASPSTRNYVQYGGVGILVFDIDHGYEFVRRIPTWSVPEGKEPENVKGIAASAMTGKVYVQDETGRQVQSEKQLEVVIANGKVIRAGDQFGIGAAGK